MKLFTFLMMVCFLQVSSAAIAQRITLSEENAPLAKVIQMIRKQSGYDFIADTKLVEKARPVSIRISNAGIEEALKAALAGQDIDFSIENKIVMLTPRAKTVKEPAPPVEVKGRVTDEAGNPLPGAVVRVKGGSQGAATDAEGYFVLRNVEADAVLQVSFMGYVTREVNASAAPGFSIKLAVQPSGLSEVVVVGYGTQKKGQMIGSVSQVSGEKVNNRAVPSVSNALAGQMPGVTVIQRSGQPGASGGNIQIRGVGSFGAATNAFILVDGIPVENLNNLDPNDIASVSVLKDASSSAIYGARASNGVILVTTKSGGKSGKVNVKYNGYVGMQKVTALPESVNSWEYAQAVNEATPGSYSEAEIEKFRNGSDPYNYPNTNWYKDFFKKSALQTGHNITVSSGNDVTQYLISAGYLSQDGIVMKNNYQRYNFRMNFTTSLSKKLKLTARLSGIQAGDKAPSTNTKSDITDVKAMMGQVVRTAPIFPLRLENGGWANSIGVGGNPVSQLYSESFDKNKNGEINGNATLEYQVFDGLKISAIGGGYVTSGKGSLFRATQLIGDYLAGPSTLSQSAASSNYKTLQFLADYNKRIKQHEFSFLGGYSFETFHSESMNAFRQNFPSNELPSLNLGSADGQTNGASAQEWALESLFGRVRYNYLNRYLLEGVLRYDGSSRFSPAGRYALFPALALGWRVSEENFIKNNLSWLTDLKLKASFGTLGNQNIGSNYPWQNLLAAGGANNYSFGGMVATGVARNVITDAGIHWESTNTKDIGAEFTLFKGLLGGSVTYFDKFTYDILVQPSGSISDVLGYNIGVTNSGKLRNKGWEFTLDHRGNLGELGYNVSANMSIIKNRIVDVGVGNIVQPNGLVGNAGAGLYIGYPMDIYFGYRADGLFVTEDEAADWADQSALGSAKKPGDIRYVDIGGPEGKPDGKITPDYDRQVLGTTIPKYTYGMNLGLNYKGFDLAVLLQGVADVRAYMSGYAGFALSNNSTVQRWQFNGRWTESNPNRYAAYPRMEVLSNSGSGNTASSSFWLLNGSYLRVKNVQLGYNLPRAVLNRVKLAAARVSLAAENLITFSHYRKGWDPETIASSIAAYYPIMRNYTLGLNVQF